MVENCAGHCEGQIIVLLRRGGTCCLALTNTPWFRPARVSGGSNRTGEYLSSNYKHITVLASEAKTQCFYFSLIILLWWNVEIFYYWPASNIYMYPRASLLYLVDVTFHFQSICSKSDPSDSRDWWFCQSVHQSWSLPRPLSTALQSRHFPRCGGRTIMTKFWAIKTIFLISWCSVPVVCCLSLWSPGAPSIFLLVGEKIITCFNTKHPLDASVLKNIFFTEGSL